MEELKEVQRILAEILHIDPAEANMHTTLARELGADSLDLYQILLLCEKRFHIRVKASEFRELHRVSDIVALIQRKQKTERLHNSYE